MSSKSTETSINSTQQTDKRNFKQIPCWYMLNSYICKQENCRYNHNSDFIKNAKTKRVKEVCRQFLKCNEKCPKYHNADELMELYCSACITLESIKSILK